MNTQEKKSNTQANVSKEYVLLNLNKKKKNLIQKDIQKQSEK